MPDDTPLTKNMRSDRTAPDLKVYEAAGGYQGARRPEDDARGSN